MRIGVLGINYKSCDLELREQVAKASARCLNSASKEAAQFGSVLLSTCNRTEIYFSHSDLPAAHSELLALLRTEIQLPFEHKLYSYFGGECFSHLALVSAGLDSLIRCETEIQRQVKMAYAYACLHHALPSSIHFLFQKSLKIGKWIRNVFPASCGKSSLAAQLFQIVQSALKNPSIFFLGNSEINRKIIAYFNARLEPSMTLCTRAPHSASEFVKKQQLRCVDWNALESWQDSDVVICGTNHHDYLILPSQIQTSPKTRFIFDLGIPRNTDPKLALHPHITLMNIEELGHFIEASRDEEKEMLQHIGDQVREEVDKQLLIYQTKTGKTVQCM